MNHSEVLWSTCEKFRYSTVRFLLAEIRFLNEETRAGGGGGGELLRYMETRLKHCFASFWQREVAKARGFVEGTILGHLADALRAGYPVDFRRGVFRFFKFVTRLFWRYCNKTCWALPRCHFMVTLRKFKYQTFSIHGRQREVIISELSIVARNNTNAKQPLLTSYQTSQCMRIDCTTVMTSVLRHESKTSGAYTVY